MNTNRKAFTLAETLITLVILGVIAAITIPALVRNHVENANRTKLKKAMTVYDTALSKMVVENGIKSNDALIAFAGNAETNCSGSAPYFKAAQNLKDENNNDTLCKFRASDGLYWNIKDITHPIISFDENNLDEINENKSFGLVGWFDNNGSLRVDDLQAATGDDKTTLTNLYNYINNVKSAAADNGAQGFMSSCTDNKDGTYTCEGLNVPAKPFTFSSTCTTLPYDNQESCPVTTEPTVVAMVQSGISWNDAQTACPEGTHLAKAAELQQLWNNGAEGNALESLCDTCSRNDYAWFWAQEEDSSDYNYAYDFSTDDAEFNGYTKDNDFNYFRVVCVGN